MAIQPTHPVCFSLLPPRVPRLHVHTQTHTRLWTAPPHVSVFYWPTWSLGYCCETTIHCALCLFEDCQSRRKKLCANHQRRSRMSLVLLGNKQKNKNKKCSWYTDKRHVLRIAVCLLTSLDWNSILRARVWSGICHFPKRERTIIASLEVTFCDHWQILLPELLSSSRACRHTLWPKHICSQFPSEIKFIY